MMEIFYLSAFDKLILKNSLLAFLIFFAAQMAFFRFLKAEQVLKHLMRLLIIGGIANISLNMINIPRFQGAGGLGMAVCFGVSFAIYGLISFHYILCIFGPYESSIRLRLLRELYRNHPRGILRTDLLRDYNSRVILERRLNRLLASQELLYDGKVYRATSKRGFFLVSDAIAKFLCRATGNQ